MSDAVCPCCRKPIPESLYLFDGQELLKSCPKCSEYVGKHVFHQCPGEFGFRTVNEHQIIQSYCGKCRSNSRDVSIEGNKCDEIPPSFYPIRSIRLLPTSDSGFGPDYDFELSLAYLRAHSQYGKSFIPLYPPNKCCFRPCG